jgi:hypothetical protein
MLFFFYGVSARFLFSEASVEISKQIKDLHGGVARPTPNLEDQGVSFCLGHHL